MENKEGEEDPPLSVTTINSEEKDPPSPINVIEEKDNSEGRRGLSSSIALILTAIEETDDKEGEEDHSSSVLCHPIPQLTQRRRWTEKREKRILCH
jgi:hypothetical protein